MLLRSGKTYNKAIMPDKKDSNAVLKKEIDKVYSTKCYPINYLQKCELFLTEKNDICYYGNRAKDPSNDFKIQLNTMTIMMDLFKNCHIICPINNLYNKIYWLNELFSYFLKALPEIKQDKKLKYVLGLKLDELQFSDNECSLYKETSDYFNNVLIPLFDRVRKEIDFDGALP